MGICDKVGEMLSGYLDRELVQQDYQLVEVHLQSCASCQKVFDEMKELRDAVSNSSADVELSREQLDLILGDLPAKTSMGLGWILLIVGSLTLFSFLGWEFMIEDEIPVWVKVCVSVIFFGLASLFVSVLRQRIVASKSDRYKDVQI